ncbi:hypothetical protein HBB16_18330 [Pseudonocardia sp. MCCB 268]|nr:hypothetical protein [Pseudonocardia cytotoxica]
MIKANIADARDEARPEPGRRRQAAELARGRRRLHPATPSCRPGCRRPGPRSGPSRTASSSRPPEVGRGRRVRAAPAAVPGLTVEAAHDPVTAYCGRDRVGTLLVAQPAGWWETWLTPPTDREPFARRCPSRSWRPSRPNGEDTKGHRRRPAAEAGRETPPRSGCPPRFGPGGGRGPAAAGRVAPCTRSGRPSALPAPRATRRCWSRSTTAPC